MSEKPIEWANIGWVENCGADTGPTPRHASVPVDALLAAGYVPASQLTDVTAKLAFAESLLRESAMVLSRDDPESRKTRARIDAFFRAPEAAKPAEQPDDNPRRGRSDAVP